jgi:hypothetical protein
MFFMLALLELNSLYKVLYDSKLRHARNCIDALWRRSMIELPKPQYVVISKGIGYNMLWSSGFFASRFPGFWQMTPKIWCRQHDLPI